MPFKKCQKVKSKRKSAIQSKVSVHLGRVDTDASQMIHLIKKKKKPEIFKVVVARRKEEEDFYIKKRPGCVHDGFGAARSIIKNDRRVTLINDDVNDAEIKKYIYI